jgi:CBS domain containing-hemolysin-like protein
MLVFSYALGVVGLGALLVIFSYLDRVYRELGRVSTGRLHANLDVFEAEVEPRIGMDRRRANVTFSLLAHLWLVVVAVLTAQGVDRFVAKPWEALVEILILLTGEVLLAMHFLPYMLVTRTKGRWALPILPLVRVSVWIVTPLRMMLDVAVSVAHISEEEEPGKEQAHQEGIEQLVEAAEEEGILQREQAHLIEQVVEFSDKRVREVMTPRPDIVAIPASASIEHLRRVLVETKFSRIPVYENSLDEIIGVVYARDLLQIPEREAATRSVRELVRPALFVPETKLGSQLLKEMQQKRQQMAIAIDEYGLVAGLVTVEDLVEEIVGEIGEEDRAPAPDVVRENEGTLVLRGSVPLERFRELYGLGIDWQPRDVGATTIGGLLNTVAGHVPVAGEVVEYDGFRFEVLEANQRKVLRLRARRKPEAAARAAEAR